jgi:hypothetical protein
VDFFQCLVIQKEHFSENAPVSVLRSKAGEVPTHLGLTDFNLIETVVMMMMMMMIIIIIIIQTHYTADHS